MRAVEVLFLICCVAVCGLYAQETKDKKISKERFPKAEISTKNDPGEVVKTESEQKQKFKNIDASDEVVEIDRSMIPAVQRRQSNYKIGFQDILTISVYRHPELSQTVSVSQDGTIRLPRIDQPINAVCKTERELASLITQLYKNYLRNPFVNVRTQEQLSQPFAVIGAVNKPGNFYLKQQVRLLRLISLAGGPDIEKSGSRVQVARIGNASGCSPTDDADSEFQFFEYELLDVLSGRKNPRMRPGDIVSVLEAQQAYVVGDVVEPQKIKLNEPRTLSEAIANAGGTTSTSKLTKVIIQRKEKDSPTRKDLLFDLKEIQANKIADPILQGGDIVVVTSSTGKKVKKGLWKLLVNGLPNVFYRIPL